MAKDEAEESERIYTIPLGRVMIAPRHRRAKRAINIIREFAKKHMKSEEVKISEDLNLIIWRMGIRRPPKRITVKMERDEDGVVTISPLAEEVEAQPSPIGDQSEPVAV